MATVPLHSSLHLGYVTTLVWLLWAATHVPERFDVGSTKFLCTGCNGFTPECTTLHWPCCNAFCQRGYTTSRPLDWWWRSDTSAGVAVTSRGRSRVSITIHMHVRDCDCKIAITNCNTQPTHTPAYYHHNAPPYRPLHLPNRPIGRLEGAALCNSGWHTQFLQFGHPTRFGCNSATCTTFSKNR